MSEGYIELALPFTICSTCESRSSSHLGNTVELALGAGVQGEESWPSPLPDAALREMGPATHLGSTVEWILMRE